MKRSLLMFSAVAAFVVPAAAPMAVVAQERPQSQQDGPRRERNSERPTRPADIAREGRSERSIPRNSERQRDFQSSERPRLERERPEGPRGDTQRPERPRYERPNVERPNGERPNRERPGPQRPDADRPSQERPQPRPDGRPNRPDTPRPDSGRPNGENRQEGRNNARDPERRNEWRSNQRRDPPRFDQRNNNDRREWRSDRGGPDSNARDRRAHRERIERDFRRNWNRDQWRRDYDRRFRSDWWRNDARFRSWSGIRVGFYFAPGYGYYSVPRDYWNRRWNVGQFLPDVFWRYRVNDYRTYGLGFPPSGTRWVYVDNSIYLIDEFDGYIVEVIRDAWRW